MGTIENGTGDEVGTPEFFEAGWPTAQETAYVAASDDERKSTEYDDVFRRWVFKDPFGGDLLYTQEAADGKGAPVLFCQELSWNGATVDVVEDADTGPYLPTAKISRTTPWAIGFSDTADNRDVLQKNNVTYSPPMLFNVIEDDSTDITKTTAAGENIYADDRESDPLFTTKYGGILAILVGSALVWAGKGALRHIGLSFGGTSEDSPDVVRARIKSIEQNKDKD